MTGVLMCLCLAHWVLMGVFAVKESEHDRVTAELKKKSCVQAQEVRLISNLRQLQTNPTVIPFWAVK